MKKIISIIQNSKKLKTIKTVATLVRSISNPQLNPPMAEWANLKNKIYYNRFNGLKQIILLLTLFIILIISFNSCTDKFDVSTFDDIEGDPNLGGDTVYVQITPEWKDFNNPHDIYVGKEPFIYVADTDNDRIVMMNLDGQILGTRGIPKPVAISQDYELNIIVCGRFDTTIAGQTISLGAVYKLDLFSVSHQIEIAPLKRILPRASDFNTPQRVYTGVTTFYDNSFYVARNGPNNSNLIDPDNSILIFRKKILPGGSSIDTLIGRVPLLDPVTTGLLSANNVLSLNSFNIRDYDLLLTLGGNNNFKVQSLDYIVTQEFTGYNNKFSPENTEMMKPNRFANPEGSVIDNSGNIFIADAGKDSIFKFNPFGDELQSFGGSHLFSQPHAVAFFDRTLYVLDTGNNRILRFILSTDLQ